MGANVLPVWLQLFTRTEDFPIGNFPCRDNSYPNYSLKL